MLVAHGFILLRGGPLAGFSPTKTIQRIKPFAKCVAEELARDGPEFWARVVARFAKPIARIPKQQRRTKHPSTRERRFKPRHKTSRTADGPTALAMGISGPLGLRNSLPHGCGSEVTFGRRNRRAIGARVVAFRERSTSSARDWFPIRRRGQLHPPTVRRLSQIATPRVPDR